MSIVDFMLSGRQQRMLRALLVHPERSYGSNEIIAIGGPGTGAGRRVLDGFERSGIVVTTARGNQRLYSINSLHPLYAELRSICRKSFGLVDLVAEELEPLRDRICLSFIFGSVAMGTERADSDLDLMVVGDVDLLELGPALERIQGAIGRTVDLNFHTPEEWSQLASDRVVQQILSGDRIEVMERSSTAMPWIGHRSTGA